MHYDALVELVKSRRSIRRFKPDPVPDEAVRKIIEVARWAPSGFNMQPWEFVVVRKEKLRRQIAEIVNVYYRQSIEMEKAREGWQGRPWKLSGMSDAANDFSQAPVYILLLGDPRTQSGLPMGVRLDQHRRETIHTSSLAGAFLYMHLAATTLGLASQWISAVQTAYSRAMINSLLDLPAALEIYDMMALGYPAIAPSGKYMRDVDEVLHYDDSGEKDFRTDAQVRTFVKKARNWNIGAHHRGKD